MAKLIEEFKAFALKGNVVDMAVGVIIGGAFGKIVSSVVGDLIMPLIAAIGGVNTTDLKVVLKPGVDAVVNEETGEVIQEAVAAVTWNYGAFIQNVADFLIIAICLFAIIKGINKMAEMTKKKEEEKPAEPEPEPAPTKEEVLLTEIRDLLKNK